MTTHISVRLGEVVTFTERLSSMIDSGLPLIKCLNTLRRQTSDHALREVLYRISLDLEGGERFSETLTKHPKVFSNFYVNMIKTGEVGGKLPDALKKMSQYLEKEDALRRNIKKAFAYPVIVLAAIVAVVSFLVVFIVPIFADIYLKMGLNLPLPTVLLVASSKAIIGYWWVFAAFGAIVIIGFKKSYATDNGRFVLDSLKLHLPIFGDLNRKVATSRFVRALSSLYASGISILEALYIIRGIADNAVIAGIVDKIQNSVKEGGGIAETLADEKIFPPIVTEMIAAGEEAGALEVMLNKSADFLDRDVEYTVSKLVMRVEPVLTLCMAAIVGFIALAIYLPMFDLTSGISRR